MLHKLKEIRAPQCLCQKAERGNAEKADALLGLHDSGDFCSSDPPSLRGRRLSQNDQQLHEVMELHLKNTQDNLTSHLDRLTAQSLHLSKELSREIEGFWCRRESPGRRSTTTRSGC